MNEKKSPGFIARKGWPDSTGKGYAGHAETGFSTIWSVRTGYSIKNGILIEQRSADALKSYSPVADPSLPGDFGRVYPSKKRLLEFCSLFGLLGYGRLVPPKHRKEVPPGSLTLGGDPVHWIMAHSHTVWIILQLLGWLEERDVGELSDVLRSLPSGPYAYSSDIVALEYWATRECKKRFLKEPVRSAQLVASRLINPNIKGINREISGPDFGLQPKSRFVFRAMIEAVYWQLADKLEQGSGVRRCPECGRFFVARDKRSMYCPPPDGLTRSRCASRLHVRAHRALKANKKTTSKHRRGK